MNISRQYVLGGLLVLLALLAALLLANVLGTVFFAVTVAFLLSPVRERLVARGLSRWAASVVATAAAFVATAAVLAPLVLIPFLRLDAILALLSSIPHEVTVEFAGYVYTVTFEQAIVVLVAVARSLATSLARAAPVLLIKFSLFVLLVFSLVLQESAIRRSLLAIVPPAYRDVAQALNRRARGTLFAIYVLQAATAVGTFVIAVPVFVLLGYHYPFTLATIAAVLQFIPIVGPSFLLAGLAVWHVVAGELVAALVVAAVGGFFVAWLPDILIRPRLAKSTANLSGGLYFIGFVGGLLSLGAVGVIAGPLVVALVAEAASLLADELNAVSVDDEAQTESASDAR